MNKAVKTEEDGIVVLTSDGHGIELLGSVVQNEGYLTEARKEFLRKYNNRVLSYLEYFQERAELPKDVIPPNITIRHSKEVDIFPKEGGNWERSKPIENVYIEVDGKEISIEELDREIREANEKRLRDNDTTK